MKENKRLISNSRILNKILRNRIQYHVKKINVPCPKEFYFRNGKSFRYLESTTITHYIIDLKAKNKNKNNKNKKIASIGTEKVFEKIENLLIND